MNLLLRSATLMLASSVASPAAWAEVVLCSRRTSPAPHSQISLLTCNEDLSLVNLNNAGF